MARYTGPSWKKSRRFKYSILENGKELQRRNYAPGQHGQRRTKLSEYGLQLNEKQKVRFTYGVNEKQFRTLFEKAEKLPGKHGENFLFLLESRLDNLVYRLGFATTRRQARQLVNHGHIVVDGKKVDIPSYTMKPGQTVALKETSRNLKVVKESLDILQTIPAYVSFDKEKMEGSYTRLPERSELSPEIDESLIVEFYNRKD